MSVAGVTSAEEARTAYETLEIGADAVVADFYELDAFARAPEDITLFKNGGGAHLDLMVARHILERWRDA